MGSVGGIIQYNREIILSWTRWLVPTLNPSVAKAHAVFYGILFAADI